MSPVQAGGDESAAVQLAACDEPAELIGRVLACLATGGTATEIRQLRGIVLAETYSAHPSGSPRHPATPKLSESVSINRLTEDTGEEETGVPRGRRCRRCAPGRPAGSRSRTEIASLRPNRGRPAFATVVATDRGRAGVGLSTHTPHV